QRPLILVGFLQLFSLFCHCRLGDYFYVKGVCPPCILIFCNISQKKPTLSMMNRALLKSIAFLKDRFNLSGDRANEQEIVAEIRKGVEFKGVNVWVLAFAIMVASIGLNVNSTAVIIGAMLISPLMGPIMG